MATQGLPYAPIQNHSKSLPTKTGNYFWFAVEEKLYYATSTTTALTVKDVVGTTILTVSLSSLSLANNFGVQAAVYKKRVCLFTAGENTSGYIVAYAATYNVSDGAWTAYKTNTATATSSSGATTTGYGVRCKVDWVGGDFACVAYLGKKSIGGAPNNYYLAVSAMAMDASGSSAGVTLTTFTLLTVGSSSTGTEAVPALGAYNGNYYILAGVVGENMALKVYAGSLASGAPAYSAVTTATSSLRPVGGELGTFLVKGGTYGYYYDAPTATEESTGHYFNDNCHMYLVGVSGTTRYFVGISRLTSLARAYCRKWKRLTGGTWSYETGTAREDALAEANVITRPHCTDLTETIGLAGQGYLLFWNNPWKEA